jgi:hypothetical protein
VDEFLAPGASPSPSRRCRFGAHRREEKAKPKTPVLAAALRRVHPQRTISKEGGKKKNLETAFWRRNGIGDSDTATATAGTGTGARRAGGEGMWEEGPRLTTDRKEGKAARRSRRTMRSRCLNDQSGFRRGCCSCNFWLVLQTGLMPKDGDGVLISLDFFSFFANDRVLISRSAQLDWHRLFSSRAPVTACVPALNSLLALKLNWTMIHLLVNSEVWIWICQTELRGVTNISLSIVRVAPQRTL